MIKFNKEIQILYLEINKNITIIGYANQLLSPEDVWFFGAELQ